MWLASLALVIALASAALPAALVQQAPAADLTGVWTGTFTSTTTTGGKDEDPAHFVLKQNGAELTGTGGPTPGQQMPVRNGKVTTTKGVTTATFQVTEGEAFSIAFELTLTNDRLKGVANADVDGRKRTATVDVGRAKN